MLSFRSLTAPLVRIYKELVQNYRLKKQDFYQYKKILQQAQHNLHLKDGGGRIYSIPTQYNKDFTFDVCSLLKNKDILNNPKYLTATIFFLLRELEVLVNNPERITFKQTTNSTTNTQILNTTNRQAIDKETGFKQLYIQLHDALSYIDDNILLNCKLPSFTPMYHMGLLGIKYQQILPSSFVYTAHLEYFDFTHKELQIIVYTVTKQDITVKINNSIITPSSSKITRSDLFEQTFIQKIVLWIPIEANTLSFNPNNKEKTQPTLQTITVDINNKPAMLKLKEKQSNSLTLDQILAAFADIKQARDLEDSNLWLVFDRKDEADDNGEHFYRFLLTQHPEIEAYYVLNKYSKDWKRLQSEGFKLIAINSYRHHQLVKKAGVLIGSHVSTFMTGHKLKHKLPYKRIVWLQHGVTKEDLSRFVNSLNVGRIEIIVTAIMREYKAMSANYNRLNYGTREIKLLGFARYDHLYELASKIKPRKQILIQFTWRGFINQRLTDGEFLATNYAQKLAHLLNSKALIELCRKYGYEIIFAAHPMLKRFRHCLPRAKEIKLFDPKDMSFQELFVTSKLMITDYSSVFFDFATLHKPVIYYQFDASDIIQNATHTGQKGYFEYQRDGFGPVVYEEDVLLKTLEDYLKTDCVMPTLYKKRCTETFTLSPQDNCHRIYNAVKKLLTPL